jgi:hypothetical protein
LDGQRQEAYNLFLGNYKFAQGQPMLWDLSTDYYLHHADPRAWSGKARRSYINWYTPSHLEPRTIPASTKPCGSAAGKQLGFFDDYWLEYYKPLAVSSMLKIFTYPGKMNTSFKYIPARATHDGRYDLSPFKVRTEHDQDVKKPIKKGVTIYEPSEGSYAPSISVSSVVDDHMSTKSGVSKRISIQRWLQPIQERDHSHHGIMKEGTEEVVPDEKKKLTPLDKSKAAQWTFTQVVHESLNPSVSEQEEEDYARYISHPQTLPLVVSTEVPAEIDAEYLDYVNGNWGGVGGHGGMVGYGATEEDLADYAAFLTVAENPLTVTEEDKPKKRYKAYRKWLLGKSLFKQQPID